MVERNVEIESLFEPGSKSVLEAYLRLLHPADIAELFDFVDEEHWPIITRTLSAERLAEVMIREGYLKDSAVIGEGVQRQLRLGLIYGADRQPVITGLERRSRPSLRVYVSAAEAPRVRGGLGVSIISTPQGVITDREARARKVGGEVLCAVW